MAFGDVNLIVSSSARTSSGASGLLQAEKGLYLNLLVENTATSGTTPTLDVSIEWSADGVNFGAAEPADNFTQITANKRVVKQFISKMPFYRVVWAIGGTTPSFTFDVWRYVTE